MPRSLKIRIDGSGSCAPISPAIPGGAVADGLNAAPSIAGFLAIGVPVFTWSNGDVQAVTSVTSLKPLADWCSEHNIGAAGQAQIAENVPHEEGTYAACRATFHGNVALHTATEPARLILKGDSASIVSPNRKRCLLHVSRQWATWQEEIIDPSKPWSVAHGVDYGMLIGNNRVTVYLRRSASSGSAGAGDAVRATYDPVAGEDPHNLPWPATADLGLWPWKAHAGTTLVSGYAVPYEDVAQADTHALAIGPRDEVLKIAYALDGATVDSADAEPLQFEAIGQSTPDSALTQSLHRATPAFLSGLLPSPTYLPSYPYQWSAGAWFGHTGAWRMGEYTRRIGTFSQKSFIKIGHASGVIDAVKTTLGSETADPVAIGHASPYSDGALWQQSDTGANAVIPFVDGAAKPALLPPDAGLQLPYLLHFAETCWVDEMTVAVRIFTGSGSAEPRPCDTYPTEDIVLNDTPITSGATTDAAGASIVFQGDNTILRLQLSKFLRDGYEGNRRVWELDQTVTIAVKINLVRGAASGTFPVTHIDDDTPAPADPEEFFGYGQYFIDRSIDPETT